MKNSVAVFMLILVLGINPLFAQDNSDDNEKRWPFRQGAVNIWGGISAFTGFFNNDSFVKLWEDNSGMSFEKDFNILPYSFYATVKLWPKFLSAGGFYTRNWIGLRYYSEEEVTTTTYYWGYNGYYNTWNYYSSSTNFYYSVIRLTTKHYGALIQVSFNDELRSGDFDKGGGTYGMEIGIGKTVAEGYFNFNASTYEDFTDIKGEAPYYSVAIYAGQYFPLFKKSKHAAFYVGMHTAVQISKVDRLINANTGTPISDRSGNNIEANFTGWQFLGLRLGYTFH